MSRGFSDVAVYVRRSFGLEEQEWLEQALNAAPGIKRVRRSPRSGQLILIDYDPDTITALGVLRCFDALGLEARLIGM